LTSRPQPRTLQQAETNSPNVGSASNWVEVSGSTNVNLVVIPIDHSLGSVFYRLVYP